MFLIKIRIPVHYKGSIRGPQSSTELGILKSLLLTGLSTMYYFGWQSAIEGDGFKEELGNYVLKFYRIHWFHKSSR